MPADIRRGHEAVAIPARCRQALFSGVSPRPVHHDLRQRRRGGANAARYGEPPGRRTGAQAFRRRDWQVPPMYSAIKQAGQALYKLARAVSGRARTAPRGGARVPVADVRRRATPDAPSPARGTYINLAQDLGEVLENAARMLRRSGVWRWARSRSSERVTLAGIEAAGRPRRSCALLQPADAMLTDMPAVNLTSLAVHYLSWGQAVTVRHDIASELGAGCIRPATVARVGRCSTTGA